MRRASLRTLQPGAILAKPIFNDKGAVLLTAGTELTQRYIQYLKGRGVFVVYIEDADTEDVEVVDIISDSLRATANSTVYHVYEALRVASAGLSELKGPALKAAINTGDFKRMVANMLPLDQLIQIVDEILNEVMDTRLLSGMSTIKSYDNYTYCHSVEMATIGIVIGRKLRLDKGSLKRLARGCLLHDIGKIFVDDAILNKPGPLTDDEVVLMRQHPLLGYELLQSVHPGDVLCNNVALQHHERQDGNGYPRHLTGFNRVERPTFGNDKKILLIAEIAAIADVYDALASDRPYRPGLAPEVVLDMIRGQAGSALNQELVKCFLSSVPTFPIGMTIGVTAGKYQGYRGIVAHVTERDLARPKIRLFLKPDGEHCEPMEMDLIKEPDIQIASILN